MHHIQKEFNFFTLDYDVRNLYLTSSQFMSDSQVIVRDIVSKAVIAQFRAHKSPIAALCFSPCGTLLVTASIHGHSINVFKIMPSSSTVYDSGSSYVHLYHLQRGLTNAVRLVHQFLANTPEA